jgi:hypothetical protein
VSTASTILPHQSSLPSLYRQGGFDPNSTPKVPSVGSAQVLRTTKIHTDGIQVTNYPSKRAARKEKLKKDSSIQETERQKIDHHYETCKHLAFFLLPQFFPPSSPSPLVIFLWVEYSQTRSPIHLWVATLANNPPIRCPRVERLWHSIGIRKNWLSLFWGDIGP